MSPRRNDTPALPRRELLRGLGALGLVGALAPGSGARAAAPPVADALALALVGAEVHVGDGTVIPSGVVLTEGARITAVGGPELRPPSGAAVVDLKGKILTPGLIAADARVGLIEIDLEPGTRDDSGGEGPIRAAYDAGAAINPRSSLIQVQAIEGITSAAVSPSGGLLSGQVALIDLVYGDRAQMVQRRGVAVRGALGQVIAGSRAATLAKLREVLDDARFLRGRKAAYDRRQTRELAAHPRDLEALFPALDRKVPLTLEAHGEPDIAAAIELAAAEKLRVVILGGTEAWRLRSELAAAKIPVIVYPSQNLPGSLDKLGARLDNAALLSAAGVEVGIACLGDAHNLRNQTQEAGIAVAYGMDWERALTAVTLTIARAYGVDADYGSVAKGKIANLVTWGGDPFEHAHYAEQVYIRGAAIPMVSRQTLLRERYRDLEKIRRRGR
ncbi:MAG: amidohydrolase family protein [Nannocystaceae bacterium]